MAAKIFEDETTVYQIFAKNLRARVLERGSISQICLDLDINRQQFNKYLGGSMLPNKSTMGKIVAYLGVGLLQLFQEEPTLQTSDRDLQRNRSDSNIYLEKALEQIKSHSSSSRFAEGVYTCYSAWLPAFQYCLRSLVILKRVEGHLVFTRLVRLDELGSVERKYRPRLQEGVVTQHKNFISLSGTEPKRDHRKIMMCFARGDMPLHNTMGGLLLTYALTDLPISCRVVLHYQGQSKDWRKYYKDSGLMPIDHPSIRSDAAAIIQQYFHEQNSILQTFDQMEAWRS